MKKELMKNMVDMKINHLKNINENLKLGTKIRTSEVTNVYAGGSRFSTTNSEWRNYGSPDFFEIQEKGNDAKRGGKAGDYIILKNNKHNQKCLEFIKLLVEFNNND